VTILVRAPTELDAAAIRRIAVGTSVRVDDAVLASLARGRRRVLETLQGWPQPIYGVTTGSGLLAGTSLTPDQQVDHQVRLLSGRAVGGPPWLPPEDVRALLAVRLRGFLAPETGASAEAVRFLVDRLNDGFVPAVPRAGHGSAGEIIPLSHAFQTFAGVGTVLEQGREVPASAALGSRRAEPYRPGPKEGMSFLQGAPLATAHALLRSAGGLYTTSVQVLATAMAVDVLGAPHGIYRAELAGTDEVLGGVLGEVRGLIDGAVPRPQLLQAPVSVRVGPQAIAHARRVLGELASAAGRVLAMPSDSPAYLDGEFVSTAGFHAAELGLRMDAATAALAHLGEVSVQRMHRMLDERFSGLPAQLTPDPGPQAGLAPLHKRAVGELHALRRLAAPASLGSIDTSAGQEDVQVFAAAAGEQLRTALDHLLVITACELISAHQARALHDAPAAPALRESYHWIGEFVPPVLVDRPLGPELTALVAAVRSRPSALAVPQAG
jgi:histidine ammonia-lyase